MSHEIPHIPPEYEDTLEHIDVEIADLHPLGILTFAEIINTAYHQAEGCGCYQCRNLFWSAVEQAVVSEARHGEDEVRDAIERYTPLINDVYDLEDIDDDCGDDDQS